MALDIDRIVRVVKAADHDAASAIVDNAIEATRVATLIEVASRFEDNGNQSAGSVVRSFITNPQT